MNIRQVTLSSRPNRFRRSRKGSVLLLTLLMIILMAFEVALVSVVVLRGLGEEGMLISRRIEAENAAQSAITQLHRQLSSEMLDGMDLDELMLEYSLGGASQVALFTNQILQITNPADGTTAATDPPIYISAWIDPDQSRGNNLHLTGRARSGGTDIRLSRWQQLRHCDAGAQLITIVSEVSSPGWPYAIDVLPDGRVFFGQWADPGNFWTWHSDTGLSVLYTGRFPGTDALVVTDPKRDRVFFAENAPGGELYTWSEGNGLSLLATDTFSTPSYVYQGITGTRGVADDGRFFIGTNVTSSLYTWKESTGLSLLVTGATKPGDDSLFVMPDGRAYFGEDRSSAGAFWTWKESTGLTTIVSRDMGIPSPGEKAVGASKDGRVFFGTNRVDNPFYTWHPNTGLSIIVDNAARAGRYNLLVSPSGRAFFGEEATPGNFWTWKDGVLTTLVDSAVNPGILATAVTQYNRIFFGEFGADPGSLWTWKEGMGLYTIYVGNEPGERDALQVDATGRVFFGEDKTNHFRTWHPDTGLSVLTETPGYDLGEYSTAVTPDGRVFFGHDRNSDYPFYTWHASSGLSYLTGNEHEVGRLALKATDDGIVFFGQGASGGGSHNFWSWRPKRDCSLF